MARSALVLCVLLAAFAAACRGSGGNAPTPSPTPTATQSAAAQPKPTDTPWFAGESAGLMQVLFLDSQHGWAIGACPGGEGSRARSCNLLETTDGGQSWRQRYDSYYDEHLSDIQFLDAENGLAVVTLADETRPAILATADGGTTWEKSEISDIELSGIQFLSPQQAYGLASGVIFRTDDGGDSWAFAYGSPDCQFSSIRFPTPEDGWAGGEGESCPCLHHTSDGGETWRVVFNGAHRVRQLPLPSVTSLTGVP